MNIAQQLITIATMLVSVHTAIGVLLHDTSMDKAFTASWEYVYYDKLESGSPSDFYATKRHLLIEIGRASCRERV